MRKSVEMTVCDESVKNKWWWDWDLKKVGDERIHELKGKVKCGVRRNECCVKKLNCWISEFLAFLADHLLMKYHQNNRAASEHIINDFGEVNHTSLTQ